jgi:hypothetical protein
MNTFKDPKWRRYLLALVLASAALLVATPAPAAATGVAGTVVEDETLVASSASAQSVTAECPPNTVLYDASGYITGATGNVTLDDVIPNWVTQTVTVTGREIISYTGSWRPTAVAICGPSLPGLNWNSVDSSNNSVNKGVTASCSGSQRVVGGGALIDGGLGNVILTTKAFQVNSTGTAADTVAVDALEVSTGYTGNWIVRVYIACADPLSGQTRVRTSTPFTNAAPKFWNPTCGGTQIATAVGGGILSDPAGLGNIVLDDMYASPAGGAPVQSINSAYVRTAFSGSWELFGYTLCANP